MPKGSVLTHAFIEHLGLGTSAYTLTDVPKNIVHPELQEPMFQIRVKEFEETVFLDRQYCYDNQFTLPSHYGVGNKILLWTRRVDRTSVHNASNPSVSLLMASDCFLLDHPLEFQRFRVFLRSKRILDTQARDFLVRNSPTFSRLVETDDGLEKVLDCLGNISEWPESETSFRRQNASDHTIEGLAKSYSHDLLPVRESEKLPAALLQRNDTQRETIFRMMYYVRDEKGSESLQVFLRDLGMATGSRAVIRKTARINNSNDLALALDALRRHLGIRIWPPQP